jgi:trimethylamine--corrinoid protein Co-methyltransferase
MKQGLVCSLEQACLDIEAYDCMHHFMRGIEVSEDTLCTELLREKGIGGHFLETDHTLRHFREEFFLPRLSDRASGIGQDMLEAAREEVESILDKTPVFSRDEALCREIDRLYDEEVERRKP